MQYWLWIIPSIVSIITIGKESESTETKRNLSLCLHWVIKFSVVQPAGGKQQRYTNHCSEVDTTCPTSSCRQHNVWTQQEEEGERDSTNDKVCEETMNSQGNVQTSFIQHILEEHQGYQPPSILKLYLIWCIQAEQQICFNILTFYFSCWICSCRKFQSWVSLCSCTCYNWTVRRGDWDCFCTERIFARGPPSTWFGFQQPVTTLFS